jgi:hypothetical protein
LHRNWLVFQQGQYAGGELLQPIQRDGAGHAHTASHGGGRRARARQSVDDEDLFIKQSSLNENFLRVNPFFFIFFNKIIIIYKFIEN